MIEKDAKEKNGFIQKHEASKCASLIQFMKFGLVGISNTAISYGIEMLSYYVLFAHNTWDQNTKIAITSVLAFFISVTNSFYWNNRYVFRNEEEEKSKKIYLLTYFKTIACYGITGLMLGPVIKIWLSKMEVSYWLACLSTLAITIPLNFFLNKFWAFRKGERKVK